MKHHKSRTIAFWLLLGDTLSVGVSVVGGFALRFYAGILPVTKGLPPLRHYLALIPILVFILLTIFSIHGLYQTRGRKSRPEELIKILLALSLSYLILIALMQFYREITYSRLFLVTHFILLFVLLLFWRFGFRALFQHLHRKGRFLEKILIVGAGELGKDVLDKILSHEELGFTAVGFLDDDPGRRNVVFRGVKNLGPTREIERVVRENDVDSIYITLPLKDRKKIFSLVKRLEDLYVEIRLIPDIVQIMALKATVEDLDGLPVVHLNAIPLEGWAGIVKRTMDVTASIIGLVILSPVLLLIAALIKREDGGPVFFKQKRMGLDGSSFLMWKFRSMKFDAERATGVVFTRKGDPRRTRIGAFLRKTSLDELPQLINVLKGEMSLVGPRPERPEFVEKFREKFPSYMVRHRVKCGITGWAQVNGYRGNTSIKKRLDYDLYYIQNWTIGLDLKIVWRTLKSGLWKNAY